jgi:hypothetical protein
MEDHRTSVQSKLWGPALVALLLVGLSVNALAAATPASAGRANDSFNKGDLIVSGVVGLGVAGTYGHTTSPSICVEVEKAITPEWSVGGVLGYASSQQKYSYYYGEYGWKYTYTIIGARGGYHFVKFIKNPKLDGYAGATLGYNHVTVSDIGNNAYSRYYTYKASDSYLLYGIHAGGRYFFNPNFAGQAELGYGIGFLSVGLCWKF